jgi:ABC-2 type transport system permease protein
MIVELLNKEYSTYDAFSWKDPRDLVRGGLQLLGWMIFLWIEWYLFRSLDKKIMAYSGYGSFDFLVLFISLSLLASSLFLAILARRVFFGKEDRCLLFALPIDEFQIIFAKVLYIWFKEVGINTLLCLPLIILYGSSHGLQAPYYVLSIFYGLFESLALIGPVCLLALGMEKVHLLLKNKEWLQLLLASALCVGLCFAYQTILRLFLTVLVNAEIGGVFSPAFLDLLHGLVIYLCPAYSLLALGAGEGDVLINLGVLFGLIILSLFFVFALLSHLYTRMISNESTSRIVLKKEPTLRLESPFAALIKKECILLFRDSSYTFAFSALLVMEPFLSYVVLSSLESVLFYNLKAVLAYFPWLSEATSLLILLLFNGAISASAAASFEREQRTLALLKSEPLPAKTILLSKICVPAFFSFLAFLLSDATAFGGGLIDGMEFALVLILGTLLILLENFAGLKENIASLEGRSAQNGVIAPFFGVLLPLLDFLVMGGLSLLSLPKYGIALVLIGVAFLTLLPYGIHGLRPYEKAFAELEARS